MTSLHQRASRDAASAAGGKVGLKHAFIQRMNNSPVIVAVRPGSSLAERPRLFGTLEAALGVAFRPWEAGGAGAAAVIEIGADAPAARREDVPTLAFAVGTEATVAAERVQLLDSDALDRRVRGLALTDRIVALPDAGAGEHVVARAGTAAVWCRSREAPESYRVGTALPELGPDEGLYALLLRRPIALVALIQFLRALTAPAEWRAAPPRAAIVFDDPNLRWRSYGFIDYRRLVEHADEHGYHAAMAMIPLDAGRAHAPTVSLFARRRDRLSLVFHGNDHIKRELMAPRDRATGLAVAAQAQRRVLRFEQRSGLAVDRVMMPPHGLCSRQMASALAALGFDGLCAIHPLPWTEERPPHMPLLGWRPAEFVDGCAVLPRMHLSSSAAEIAMRAFADQAVVLYGHHEDVADGLAPLATAAAAVNRMGDVRWMSVGEIACTNHALRVADGIAAVRPFARRVRLDLPADVDAIQVEAPDDAMDPGALTGWSLGAGTLRRFGTSAALGAGRAVEVRLHGRDIVDAASVAGPAWRPWPRVRRAATEARDRLRPLTPVRARP
jgi:hypothetical protein